MGQCCCLLTMNGDPTDANALNIYMHLFIFKDKCSVSGTVEFEYFVPFYVLFSSVVKMVNQLLAGVHIASGAEAMAFGARLGLNTRTLFDVITNSGGTSWYVSLLSFEVISNCCFLHCSQLKGAYGFKL